MPYDYDLYVIGGGSGGVRAARTAAALGARVGLAEEDQLGGTCVNAGCIPKKLLAYASHFGEDLEDARGFGWSVSVPRFDWATLLKNKDTEIARLNGVYERLLGNAGVVVHQGRARLLDPHLVEVDGTRYSTRYVLLAVGGRPFVPEGPGYEHAITSNEAFRLQEFPSRIAVVGAGYIALEFAGIFAGLGSKVTLIHRGHAPMRGFDEDIRKTLTEELPKRGIDLRLKCMVTSIEKTNRESLLVHLSGGDSLETAEVLVAVGRRPYTERLGLAAVGIETAPGGGIAVDRYFRTSAESVFAVGDCIDRVQLTPVALAEGMAVAHHLFGEPRHGVSYESIPTAVFCNPQVGTVGLTEAEAREKHGDIEIYLSRFRPLKHTLTGRDTQCMMKIIVESDRDRVVGLHMVGDDAAEITQGFAVAIKCGATKAQLDATLGIHPTAAEEFVTMRTQTSL